MAEMIPDRLPMRSSAGEQRMFAALQKLDDDCLVYYEPLVRQRYPDFIVVLPDTGVLVIEVKGWHASEIRKGDTQEILVHARGNESVELHPARQARDYMHRLRDECRGHPFAETLLNATGPRAGAFVFPFGHIAVLSNITRAQLNDPARAGLAAVFSQGNVVTRDGLVAWGDSGRRRVESRACEAIRSFLVDSENGAAASRCVAFGDPSRGHALHRQTAFPY